jgi:hypothetical protein
MTWRHHTEGTRPLHVWPEHDRVQHNTEDDAGDCICGPATEPVKREDGSIGWVIRHHSLDGREKTE